MPDFHALYEEAVSITACCKEARDALLQSPEEFREQICKAREELSQKILDHAPDAIKEAAAKGTSTAELLKFHGNDFIQDISILFLLKGPKPMTPKLPDNCPGPLLPELQDIMKPFTIVHDWDGISGGNRLIARWP